MQNETQRRGAAEPQPKDNGRKKAQKAQKGFDFDHASSLSYREKFTQIAKILTNSNAKT